MKAPELLDKPHVNLDGIVSDHLENQTNDSVWESLSIQRAVKRIFGKEEPTRSILDQILRRQIADVDSEVEKGAVSRVFVDLSGNWYQSSPGAVSAECSPDELCILGEECSNDEVDTLIVANNDKETNAEESLSNLFPSHYRELTEGSG